MKTNVNIFNNLNESFEKSIKKKITINETKTTYTDEKGEDYKELTKAQYLNLGKKYGEKVNNYKVKNLNGKFYILKSDYEDLINESVLKEDDGLSARAEGVKVVVNKNQFGYTTIGIIIDENNKKFELVDGQTLPSGKYKKASKKSIRDMADELEAKGYKRVRGPHSLAESTEMKEEIKENAVEYLAKNDNRIKNLKEDESDEEMPVNEMWDRLLAMGTSEETLQTITSINGYSTETLLDVLYAQYGYRSFDQLDDEEDIDENCKMNEESEDIIQGLIDRIRNNLGISTNDIYKDEDEIKFLYNGKSYRGIPVSTSQIDVYNDDGEKIGYGVVVDNMKEELFTEYTDNDYLYELVGGDYAGTYTREEAEKLPILEPELSPDDSEIRNNGGFTHRKELDNQLQFKGYLGPMWSGTKDGKGVIRYETQEVYDILSR